MVKGSQHKPESIAKLSASMKGKVAWNKANGRDPVKTRIRQKRYLDLHPERRKQTCRSWRLKNVYHITPEEYQEMYKPSVWEVCYTVLS